MKQLRQDPLWREYFREYSRYHYWNVIKPIYNKILVLQWAHGVAKKRQINRNGYWYVLNRGFFENWKRNFRKELAYTEKVIEFLRTGRGRLVGDRVVLDQPSVRKKFNAYLDSDEAMNAPTRPKWEPEEIYLDETRKKDEVFR